MGSQTLAKCEHDQAMWLLRFLQLNYSLRISVPPSQIPNLARLRRSAKSRSQLEEY